MKPGQRVRITAQWSSMLGQLGRVVPSPDGTRNLFVVIDGDERPMRVGENEVTPVAEPEVPWVAGE